MDNRSWEYELCFIFMKASCNCSTMKCSFERILRFILSSMFFSFSTLPLTSSEISNDNHLIEQADLSTIYNICKCLERHNFTS